MSAPDGLVAISLPRSSLCSFYEEENWGKMEISPVGPCDNPPPGDL